MTDRGISDVVGFTLMFSIIIMSVAIVTTTGITQLSELSEREGINSAERGMEAFAGSADDLTRHGDLFRQAAVSPSGGLVWINDTSLDLWVYNASRTPTLRFTDSIQTNALEHRFSRNPADVSVAYESGGVLRTDGAGAVVRPQWRCTGDTAVVNVVRLTPGGDLSLGSGFGSDTGDVSPTSGDEILSGDVESTDDAVRFQLTRLGTTTHVYEDAKSMGRLTVEVDAQEMGSPRQWGTYLDRDWADDPTSQRYECPGLDRVVIRVVSVELTA